MEKKLRRKFILMSMLSLLVVLLLLFGGINIVNYTLNTNVQDEMLRSIAEGGFMMPPPAPGNAPFGGPISPEIPSMTRFFSVHKDKNGNITSTGLDYISSVTAEQAAEYANAVGDKVGKVGYYKEYRYYIYKNDSGTVTLFLNCANQLSQMRTLLLISLLLSAFCFVVMLILVTVFSKRAVAPYVLNTEIQKRFITDASHELKTPLTSIATSADVLALDIGENEWLNNIRSQTSRLSKLVGNLVMMSRLDEEQPIPDRAEFALSEAIWESAEPIISTAKATGKQFETHIEENLKFYGDVVSIQQMVSILLDNAVKYSNDYGYIRLDAYRKRQKIIIEVFNTCDELDIKNLSHLFDRFYRGDPSRSNKIAGTGVGLSIAKSIAKSHGGDISVKSQNGNLIIFTAVL